MSKIKINWFQFIIDVIESIISSIVKNKEDKVEDKP